MGLMMKNKIVLIESDEILRQYLKERLNKAGMEVVCCKDGFEGSVKIKNENKQGDFLRQKMEKVYEG